MAKISLIALETIHHGQDDDNNPIVIAAKSKFDIESKADAARLIRLGAARELTEEELEESDEAPRKRRIASVQQPPSPPPIS